MGYLRRRSNYLKRMTLSDPAQMMSIADHVAIVVETLRIDSGCSLEKEFTELIHPWYLRRLTQGMRWDEIFSQGRGVPDDFLHASILT